MAGIPNQFEAFFSKQAAQKLEKPSADDMRIFDAKFYAAIGIIEHSRKGVDKDFAKPLRKTLLHEKYLLCGRGIKGQPPRMDDEIFRPKFDAHIEHLKEPFQARQPDILMSIKKWQGAWAMAANPEPAFLEIAFDLPSLLR